MPIRYDALLVKALAAELTARFSGRRVEELHFDSEARRIRIVLAKDEELLWLLLPGAGYLLHREAPGARGRRSKTSRGILPGARELGEVTAEADERRMVFDLGTESLIVELHTNQWNALFLSGQTIRRVLWPRHAGGRPLYPNSPYVPPGETRRWVESPPTPEEWSAWWDSHTDSSREAALVREVAWSSRLNRAFLFSADPDSESVRARLVMLHPAAAPETPGAISPTTPEPPECWLLQRTPVLQPYPVSLEEEGAIPATSLLAAMQTSAKGAGLPEAAAEVAPSVTDERSSADLPDVAARTGGRGAADEEQAGRLEVALRRRLLRAEKRTAALIRQLEGGEDSSSLRDCGQLLLARKELVPRGAESVRLVGFDGRERIIALDPAADAVRNAEFYFDRARRRTRAERDLPAKIEAASAREVELSEALEALALEGVSEELWRQVGGREPEPGGSAARNRKPDAPRLPYRRLRSAGGFEIRVGRSARGNDDLTFRHSSPEDIWLHVRQAPGAHVILRWGDRDQNPPESEIRAAALVAAEFSDARSSGLVPVDWTRRKHVRKPRKSSPGSVIPDRVRTVFVEPDPARVRAMVEAGPDAV